MSSQLRIQQVVPPEWCFKCDVCCRFPEKESFLAPYFTRKEIISAFPKGVLEAAGWAAPAQKGNESSGCKISLTPFKEGYICPAFNPATSHCMIYNNRPLDCVIYPFAIMWSADRKEILLGVDMKCPYVEEYINSGTLADAETEMRSTLDSSPVLDIILDNPGLIGPFQDDVAHAAALTNLTRAHSKIRKNDGYSSSE